MKILNKLKYLIIGALIMVGATVFAANLQPSFTPSLIPVEDAKYYLGSTSPARAWAGLNVYEICLSGDCKTAWPTGGGGSGGGTWGTTTSSVTGRLINYSLNATDIVLIGGTATSTGATEYWFDPNTQNAHIGSSNIASTTIMGILNLPTLSNGGLAVFNGLVSSGATTTAGTGLTYSGNAFNVNTSQNISTLSNLTSNGAILTSGGTGALSIYSGTSCTNQFVRSLSGSIVATCATVANTDLANSSITINGSSVSLGGSITVASTTLLSDLNNWTKRQDFSNSSTSLGSFVYSSSTNLFAGTITIPNLAVPAGSFIAVNASGQIIATTSPTGGSGTPAGSNGQLQYNASGAFGGVSTSTFTPNSDFSTTGTIGNLVGGSNSTLALNMSTSHTWGGTQAFTNTANFNTFTNNGSASTTNLAITALTGVLVGNGSTKPISVAVSGTDIKTINGSSILGSGDLTVTGGSGLASSTPWTTGAVTYVTGLGTVGSVATSSIGGSSSISFSGTSGAQVGGTNGTFSINTANPNTWSVLQTFNYSSSTAYSSFLTASSTFYQGAGLSTCNSASSALTWSGGTFGCNSITGGSGASPDWQKITDPFNVTALTPTTTIPLYIQGTATSSFAGKMVIGSSTGSYANCFLCVTGKENSFMQFNIQNLSGGSSASSDIVATADVGTDNKYYLNTGINGSGGGSTPFPTALETYLYSSDSAFNIGALGTTSSSAILKFYTGSSTTTPTERLRITSTGSLVLATTTRGILRTDSSGTIYASSATTTLPLFNAFTNPDTGGNSWIQPSIINAPASIYGGMVYIASSTSAKTGFYGSIHIPSNFASSTSQISIGWTATSTSNSVVFDFDYRCIGGTNTTSLYQTSWQESTTTTVTNPSTAGFRKVTTLDINTGYWCTPDSTMEFYVARDGADAADTSTVDLEIYDASILLPTQ